MIQDFLVDHFGPELIADAAFIIDLYEEKGELNGSWDLQIYDAAKAYRAEVAKFERSKLKSNG